MIVTLPQKKSKQYTCPATSFDGIHDRFRSEFVEGSAIAPSLYEAAVDIVEDTGHWEPNRLLNQHVSTQWQTQRPHSFVALAALTQETGEIWQGKPANPRPDWKKTRKQLQRFGWDCDIDGPPWVGIKAHPEALVSQKYETPKGAGSQAFLPPVPIEVRRRISQRCGVEVPLIGSFWQWLELHPEVAVIFTEGGKKALSLLSQGHVAIALYGVNGGYSTKDRLGNPVAHHLIESVQRFAVPGRAVTLAFDQDSDVKTRRRVSCALLRFGGLLQTVGCVVRVAEWRTTDGKGIDDLIVNRGAEAATGAIASAMPLEEWRLLGYLRGQLTRPADLRVNIPSLEAIAPESIPTEGIVAIVAQKGTGKTKLTAQLVEGDRPTLLAGHRIALMRNLCSRLGLRYRGDIDQTNGRFHDGSAYVVRVGTCVDSLINPAFKAVNFEGCDLVIDEGVQVFRHLLTSSTCNREGKRGAILRRFAALVKAARRVILADADLSNDAIAYIEALRGDGKRAFLLRNDYQPEPWPVDFIEARYSSAIVAQLLQDVQAGDRVFVPTDSRDGSKRLNKLIETIEGVGHRVLLINSETSGGEFEQAFITSPDSELAAYDVVIATPSMATGVSIEADHFDKVYGIFWGQSSTDADMLQALARVRAPIPRVVWCAERGGAFSRITRDTSPQAVKDALQQQVSATASILSAQLDSGIRETVTSYDWQNPHVELFSRIEAGRNRSMWSLRTALKVRLIHEGHRLSIQNLEENEAAKMLLKEARETIKAEHAKAIANANDLDATAAAALTQAESLSPDERLALEKYQLSQFYCCEVTEALVLADDNGKRRRDLVRLEATLNEDIARDRDISALEQQQRWQSGVTPWDIPQSALKRLARQSLGLLKWLNTDAKWTTDDLEQLKETALSKEIAIKQALGVTIKDTMSGAQILGMLLQQLGLKTQSQQYREGGDRKRRYWLNPEIWQDALDVLNRRRRRREAAQQQASHTPPIEDQHRVCDTTNAPTHKDLAPGALVRLVSSGADALVEAIEGAIATLSDESGQLFTANISDLSLT